MAFKAWKADLHFSTTDETGDCATEYHVRQVIAGMADLMDMDGYTLTKAVAGYWKGKEEDAYILSVIYGQDGVLKTVEFLNKISKAIKLVYDQQAVLITVTELKVMEGV